MSALGVANYVLTEHALFEVKRRAVDEDDLRRVLESLEQRFDVRPGRVVLQSRVPAGEPAKSKLLRVVVDIDHRS